MTQLSASSYPLPQEASPIHDVNALAETQVLIDEPDAETHGVQEVRHKLSLRQRLSYAASSIVVAAEVSPANEVIRGATTLYVGGVTHNPIASAVALAGSTLLVEGAAALAATPLLNSDTASKGVNAARRFMKRYESRRGDGEFSPLTYAIAALAGGSAVSMALKKYDSPEIEKKNLRSHGVKTALGLTAVVGASGLAAPEVVELAQENPLATGVILAIGIAVAAGKRIKRSIERHRNPVERWADTDKYGLQYGILEDTEEREKATVFEQIVWYENNFGNLEEQGYTKYFSESRVIAGFEDEKCIGMARMFRNTVDNPPFIKEMKYGDEKKREELTTLYKSGELEELGTFAVDKKYRGKKVNEKLYRVAYRDARERGVRYWGIIMEPERVEKMNKKSGSTFEQLGETRWYQGGDCAAFVMDLDEVNKHMHDTKFFSHLWLTKLKLRASDK